MARRGENSIFSTSFIDMICVALCSQIILWIVAADEAPPPRPAEKQLRYFEMTQVGVIHLCQYSDLANDPSAGRHAQLFRPAKSPGVENLFLKDEGVMETAGNAIPGVTISWVSNSVNGQTNARQTAGLRIVAVEDCEEFSLEIPVEACSNPDDIHYIRCESSFFGPKRGRFYFLCETKPYLTHRENSLLPADDLDAFTRTVAAIPDNDGKLIIQVKKHGLITVSCPGENETDDRELRRGFQTP